MAAPDPGLARATPIRYEVRWLSGGVEGRCWIRGVSEDDVITEFQENAGDYGAPHEQALVVSVVPRRRASDWARAA